MERIKRQAKRILDDGEVAGMRRRGNREDDDCIESGGEYENTESQELEIGLLSLCVIILILLASSSLSLLVVVFGNGTYCTFQLCLPRIHVCLGYTCTH